MNAYVYVCVSVDTYLYIFVLTRTYLYVLVRMCTYLYAFYAGNTGSSDDEDGKHVVVKQNNADVFAIQIVKQKTIR